ncbi:MAG: response regulator, partial [Candidatus Aminicenantes bacterium]|nr:response regulator [Candidatus Aminicenantes bacterium]
MSKNIKRMPNKILVVDDEKSFVKANKTSILTNRDNYIIKTAFNGKEALDILEKEEVDLIILDVKMPVMDGIQFLVELHNRNIWLPIIILTSFSNIAEKEKEEIIRDFGVVEIIEKPVNFEKLEKRIEKEQLKIENLLMKCDSK